MKKNAKELCLFIQDSESDSWKANIKALKELFRSATNSSIDFLDCLVMLEVCISEGLRADCIILGKNVRKEATGVVMELKQWSDDFISKPESEGEIRAGKVMTKYRYCSLRLHPSRQVSDYRWKSFFIDREIQHVGMVYCYNCESGTQTYKVLYDSDYDDYIKECKPYTQKTKGSLVKALLYNLQFGGGQEVYDM